MKLLLLFSLVFTSTLFAQEHMLKESPYQYVQQSIGKGKPYFLEVGSDSCYSCQAMGKKLYRIKQQHKDFELHFINVGANRAIAQHLKVQMIPTQIIYDAQGKEVYRHIGLLKESELIKLFSVYKF